MRRRRVPALVVVVAAVIVAGAALLVLVGYRDDDGSGDAASAAGRGDDVAAGSTAPAAGASPDIEPPADDPAGASPTGREPPEVAEIMDFVADARGLPFLEPVPVDLLDDDEFEARMREIQADDLAGGDAEEREATAQLWQALELVDEGDDLFDLIDRIGIEAALGFYELETKRMVVRGADLTPLTRVTLAHELTHALDDQHFGLDRPELDESDGEEAFGFLVLSEGSAESVARRYEAALPVGDRGALDAETLDFTAGMDLTGVPFELLLVVQLPYLIGPDLVDVLIEAGGRDRLDAAFADPPVTSEETLEPAAYIEGEVVRPVTPPPASGTTTGRGVFGAAGLLVLFPNASGFELAQKWGGDRYVQWLDPDGRACVRVDLLGEDAADSDRYAEVLGDWAGDHGDAEVERLGETVRLTACA